MKYKELYEDPKKNLMTKDYKRPMEHNERFDRVWKLVESQCSEVLDLYRTSDKRFYRGATGMNAPIYLGEPRKDRRPLHSSIMGHDFTNYGLKVLGYTTNRSNSVAMTGDKSSAANYGNPYIFFPKNGFQVLWAQNESDWIEIVDSICEKFINEYYDVITQEQLDYFCKICNIPKKLIPEDYPSPEFVNWMTDQVDRYSAEKLIEAFPEQTKEFWQDQKKVYGFTNNIKGALESEHEIMMSGAEYYAFLDARYGHNIKVELGKK